MRLLWSRRAQRQLTRIQAWIGRSNSSAAERVVAKIVATARRLEQFPGLGHPSEQDDIRLLQAAGLTYVLPYRVAGDDIEILAVFDQRRDPEDML